MHKIRVYTAACGAILLTALTVAAAAQQDKLASGAERTAQTLERIRAEPLALRDFLKRMPKGADLHSHLSGAVYAETHIRDAIADGLCVDQDAKAFAKSQPVIASAELEPVCEQDQVPATALPKNQRLYNGLVDSFSMRGFVPSGGITGHDHFFDAFAKFGGTDPRHTGEWVDEVAARAAGQNIQYLELMVTPTWRRLNTITKGMTWREDLKSLKDELMAKGLLDDIPAARAFLDEADALRRDRGRCGTSDESPACQVVTRYIYQVYRNTPKESVLAQTLFGFELASVDPRVAGINLVGSEDNYAAMARLCRPHANFPICTRALSQGSSQPACRRAVAWARSTGRPLLPCAPGGGCRAHRPHRPRGGRDL